MMSSFTEALGKRKIAATASFCEFNLCHFDDVVLHSHTDIIIKTAQNFLHSHSDISDTARHWHCTDHSSFDAFLHSHADISGKARHSWNGTDLSSSANIHWPSVVIVCSTQSCHGNYINHGNNCNDCNDCNNGNGPGYNVENLIALEGYVMDRTNLKFVRILNAPVVLHTLTYPHFMLIVDPIHTGRLDRPACRLTPGSRH